jgi:hypothetical protein
LNKKTNAAELAVNYMIHEKGFTHIDTELSDGYRYGEGIQYGK